MLKRYQILMNDWLADYWQFIATKYDFSFSEMVRLALCKHIIDVTKVAFPKYKANLDGGTFKKIIKKRNISDTMPSDELHTYISKLYFEARKAADLWTKGKKSGKVKDLLS